MSSPATTINENDTLGPNARRIRQVCPALFDLLNSHAELLHVLDHNNNDDSSRQDIDTEIPWYWHHVHLMLVFRVLVARTSTELATAVMVRHSEDPRPISELPYAEVTPAQLSERLQLFQSLLKTTQENLTALQEGSSSNSNNTGVADEAALCMARLAAAYQLKPVELRVIQFLVTTKIQPSPSVLDLLIPRPSNGYYNNSSQFIPHAGGDESMAFTAPTLGYVCGITSLHWSTLANEDHTLCKDRVLIYLQDEYGGDSKLGVSEEACRALLGWKLKSEDKLKLSGTKLLQLIEQQQRQDEAGDDESSKNDVGLATKGKSEPNSENNTAVSMDKSVQDTVDDILSKLEINGTKSIKSGDEQELMKELLDDKEDDDALLVMSPDDADTAEDFATKSDQDLLVVDPTAAESDNDLTTPRAYKSELEYLHQFFEIVMHKVIYSRQRVAQDLRNASLSDNKPSWMRNPLESSSKLRSVGEVSAKLRLACRKMELSLELTRQEDTFYPRLEVLAEQLQLDEFQKFVLVYLAGSMISPIFKSCINGEDSYRDKHVTVGDLLVAYFETFAEQVSNRTYFYKSSTLIRKGLIKNINTYVAPADLTDQEVRLDRRVLDCIVGLDKESSEISHGSHLYEPKVSLDSVVLPDKLKETIIGAVTHFEQFRTYRKHNPDFDEAIAYGVGLTLMFCGKSGTGKTMTANAIAAKLSKKLLLVNFPLLHQQSGKDSGNEASKYQSIFREAELSDAIIFIDECESLFSRRSNGGSADLTELLTELERFEGIVFLATNRPFDLDEAMYRRISEVFEFKPPNYLERLEIWKLVTSHKAVPCDESIDWEAIALKYELTGGFIKNAVISALLDAVGRDPHAPKIVEVDILNGCKKQVRGALQMVDFNERVIPRGGVADLVVSDDVLAKLHEIVKLEKARGILFGSWGFDDDMRARQGTTALFWGPSGSGRSRSAEAVGFELGKPLKVVDLPRLLSERKGGYDSGNGDNGAKAIRSVFQEARLMDAVLILDGFSLDTEQNGGGGTGGADDARLLNLVVREMSRFPGVVIMMVDTSGSLDVFVSRIDKSLVKNLKFVVEFQLPSINNRQILWEKLIPPSLPVDQVLDFKQLAEASHEFSVAHIGNAIYRAAAAAALRKKPKERVVSMKDLFAAIEEEKTRGESAVDRWVKAQYI